MPTRNHGKIQMKLGVELCRYSARFDVLSEPTIKVGDANRTPDLALFPVQPSDWRHDEYPILQIPLLTVEILSPTQGFNSIIEKLDTYFANGVKSCWVVQPAAKSLTVFHSIDDSRTFDRGVVRDEALEIEVNLDTLFA